MTENSTEQDLIEAIREAPSDTVSRGAYADWLEEHGATDRAALIRINIDLGNCPDAKRAAELQAECDRLLPQCQNEWESFFLPLGAYDVHLGNGYPFSITIPVQSFIANAPALLAAAPFEALCPAIPEETVHQTTKHQDLRALVKSPHLTRMPELNLSHWQLGDEGMRVLARSPHLMHLKTLKLGYNNVKDRGAAFLAKGQWRALTCLDLVGNSFGSRGRRALAESPHFSADMRVRMEEFDGPFSKFQEWERSHRLGGGSGTPRGGR